MQLPDSVKDIRARYVARFPIPQGAPGPEIEEQVRQWSIRLAEQVAYELPNQGWGTKRADPNRPISKDGLAWRDDEDRGGRLWIFDMVTGAGTGNGRLVENPEAEDITGQVFVPVTPTNHLGAAPKPSAPPAQPLADLVAVVQAMSNLTSKIDTLQRRVEDIAVSCGRIEAQAQATAENFAALDRNSDQRHIAVLAVLKHLDEKPYPAYTGALARVMRFTPEAK